MPSSNLPPGVTTLPGEEPDHPSVDMTDEIIELIRNADWSEPEAELDRIGDIICEKLAQWHDEAMLEGFEQGRVLDMPDATRLLEVLRDLHQDGAWYDCYAVDPGDDPDTWHDRCISAADDSITPLEVAVEVWAEAGYPGVFG